MSLLSPLVPAFPNNLTNGTPADASQVMADFNTLRNAINNTLNATGATGGDQYVGLTTDARFNGTSVHDALTQLIDRQSLYTDTGTTNALVITPNPAMTALTAGQAFWFKPANTTTSGSATINISGIGAVGLANQDGTLLLAGMLIAGSYYMAVTSGPGNPVRVLNPSRVTGSYTGTGTGWASTAPTATINYAISPDGKLFTLSIPNGFSGTSNASTCTITGGPTVMQPTTGQAWQCTITDNSVTTVSGNMFIAAGSSTISFGNQAPLGAGGSFTASGTKTCPRLQSGFVLTVSYPLSP